MLSSRFKLPHALSMHEARYSNHLVYEIIGIYDYIYIII